MNTMLADMPWSATSGMLASSQAFFRDMDSQEWMSRECIAQLGNPFVDAIGFYVQLRKPSLQGEFRPNGPALCQPGASPLLLPTSFVRYLATFIGPVPFLRDPIRLDRIGEHRWWAKIVDNKNHTPSASCGWWKRSKASSEACSFYGA